MSDDADEDWFERALQDSESEGGSGDGDTESADGTENEPGEAAEDRPAGEAATPETGVDGEAAGDTAGEGADQDGESDAGTDQPSHDEGEPFADEQADSAASGGDPFGGFGGGDQEQEQVDGDDGQEGTDPFGGGNAGEEEFDGGDQEDFGFGDLDSGGGEGGDGAFGGEDRDGAFGGGSGDGAFGGQGGEEFGGGQDDFGFGDFGGGGGTDFGGGGGGTDFGGGGGGETDFDEEEFDSDIDRIELGIEGLDDMILGGVPKRSLMVTIGSAGTGKTTFGLQFLHRALRDDGKAVYLTLEESREAILSTAEEKGWPFREYEETGQLAVVAMDPIEMANSLSSIRNDISRLISEFGADRLVLDSVSLLEMMYDHPAKRRSEVFDFARSLKRAGVTTMLTSEASEENAYSSRYGIVEYLVDAVFILQYVRPSDFRETRLAVEIQKIRDANHSRETKPYEITNDGLSVYRQANIF